MNRRAGLSTPAPIFRSRYFSADAAVRLAERNAFVRDERVRLGGGVDVRIQADAVRPEPNLRESRRP